MVREQRGDQARVVGRGLLRTGVQVELVVGTGDYVEAGVIAIESKCSRLYWNTDEDNATARKLYDTYTLESGKRQYRIPLI